MSTTTRTPQRLHRPAVRGWTVPEGAVYVGRRSRWANPWAWKTRDAIARVPALDGSDWEVETRISAPGMHHPYRHADGRITSHHTRALTRAESVAVFRRALTDPSSDLQLWQWEGGHLTLDDARAELAGRDLACLCAPGQACHADVLLELSNTTPKEADR
ncbi:DUF4326 domain-containing protein [Nocardiopsis sp. NPDC006198]|uniref:DUF4326 domain-containing protein n=1 Tax=Nocardiopsis sp. NPDC006198 TaxID=3154472 RepID=UPI0033AFB388